MNKGRWVGFNQQGSQFVQQSLIFQFVKNDVILFILIMEATDTAPGSFQLRTFQQIPPFQINSATQLDIYIFKKGFENVGVKIRNPNITKKNNYEFSNIEVKLRTERVDKYERWFKTFVPLKKQFKFKDNNVQELNQVLKKALKQYSKQSDVIKQWAEAEIHSLVKIEKEKRKGYYEEVGMLVLERIFPKQQNVRYYYKTQSYEANSITSFKNNEHIVWNMSYPFLLQKLFG